MELVNTLYKYLEKDKIDASAPGLLKGAIETVIILLSPFVPHIMAELWTLTGKGYYHPHGLWPRYDEAYVKEERVMIAVQIN